MFITGLSASCKKQALLNRFHVYISNYNADTGLIIQISVVQIVFFVCVCSVRSLVSHCWTQTQIHTSRSAHGVYNVTSSVWVSMCAMLSCGTERRICSRITGRPDQTYKHSMTAKMVLERIMVVVFFYFLLNKSTF